ncbi:MAG TPA: alpha-L-rhamnosidase N-terminal domain-containing protein, partial [Puia sp.]|nr:alpha-L-rhamnosidase N-terminal domain-containing protein [Puia sp.]
MKKIIRMYVLLQLTTLSVLAQLQVSELLCEHLSNPIGIDIRQPRFGWQIMSATRNTRQVAYEIRVGIDAKDLSGGKHLFWSSGKRNDDSSVNVTYTGPALQPGVRYYWQVRVWDNHGMQSPWSDPAYWQTAMLSPSDWKAKWIGAGGVEDTVQRPSPLFRKEFEIRKKIRSATAYITAHGLYEAALNGARVGKNYLTPGWTSYQHRLAYQVYDVTGSLHEGKNAIAVTLGNGWYRGYIGFANKKDFYGKDLALLFQLDISYSDGSTETVVSDESWKSATGAIRSAEIYYGERIDARQEKKGWTLPGYDDAGWSVVRTASFSMSNLLAAYNEPITAHETFQPVRVFRTPRGEQVIDF